ncbi:MAG: alpha-E domain-containing protein [Caldilineaceae bacterium]|nr:alpha-E domain-containing protein [Caldilineaceae bacterium]
MNLETAVHTPVMLSRVADSLYWMSRYLERAKHSARLLNVHFDLMLDQSHETAEQYRQYVLASLQLPSDYDKAEDDYSLTRWMALERDNENSVRACVAAARENARQVREQISTEMWEQINQVFLFVEQVNIDAMWESTPQEFFQNIKSGIHLFQGLTDSTMVHNEGWQFIQAGRFMERSIATAALMDVFFCPAYHLPQATLDDPQIPEHLLWLGLLRSCTAFEAYAKLYTAELQPRRILEFLVLNAQFPHAINFSVQSLRRSLQGAVDATQSDRSERAYRRASRLHAELQYAQVDEIVEGNLHTYFAGIQQQCVRIHDAIYQSYITYPIIVN